MSILTTPRLYIRKATLNDSDFIFTLLNQRSFIDNIADKQIRSMEDACNYIKGAFFDAYELGEKAPYIVTLKDGTAIGIAGFYQRPIFNVPDIGYAFLDEFTGQGYAREAISSLLNFAKDKLELSSILAITSPDNQPSIKLLNAVGLMYQSKVVLDPSLKESNLYRLDF
ncbi:GNAT family N-acetyltransferase [Pseudoalteromonas sp. JBTF-M23]|uniref:GNAT family N-acetyltransferase n=1 Tax=Pseudoalteromonas caenipelagi TaxID=2726988 RepID=A0A849VEK9_9GAMM|nr:GNAT family N-acetyltransferase [Pseudoalteromonas caenipelagi]NOU50141.1 GNAT family N-acetyltransferase [Pseudoalteromonas caenipelagi]